MFVASLHQGLEGSYFGFVVEASRARAQPVTIWQETANSGPEWVAGNLEERWRAAARPWRFLLCDCEMKVHAGGGTRSNALLRFAKQPSRHLYPHSIVIAQRW